MRQAFKKLGITLAVFSFALNGMRGDAVFAATQGTLGSTSTGSVTISVTKPARANITSLTDITLPAWSTGLGDQTLTEDVCVYSTRVNGGYTVKATGSGSGGAFSLTNGASNLPYTVSWNAGGVNSLSNTGTALVSGTTSGALTNAATDSSTCTGATPGPTARIIVGLLETDLDAISDGTYTGVLTLLVTPN